MSWYVINKTTFSKSGVVVSRHDDLESAKTSDSELQKQIKLKCGESASVPTIIIQSKNELELGAVVTPADY